MTISFESLHESHFPLLLKWLETPHVKKWWDQDMRYTLDLVREKYSSYVKGYKLVDGQQKPIQGFIIHNNQNPIGYIQINKELADYGRIYALNLNNYLKNSYFKKICKSDLSNIEAFLYEAELISNVLIRSCDFEKLKTFRDKYIAHAEQINTELTKYLPSINAIDEFIDIAIDLSVLIHNLFSPDSSLDSSARSMKVATQNLVHHVIDGGSI
jgi:hypothetical protein